MIERTKNKSTLDSDIQKVKHFITFENGLVIALF